MNFCLDRKTFHFILFLSDPVITECEFPFPLTISQCLGQVNVLNTQPSSPTCLLVAHYLLPSRVCISRKLVLGAEMHT